MKGRDQRSMTPLGVYLRDWFTVSSRPLFLARKTREGMNLTQVAAPNKEVNTFLPFFIFNYSLSGEFVASSS